MQALGIRLATAAAICVTATAAPAAVPQVSGKYAFLSQTSCAATLKQFKSMAGGSGPFVNDVAPTQGGLISANIGYITFDNTNKTATISGSTLVEGAGFRVQGKSSFGWTQHADNLPDPTPYSFTASTFTFGGQTYQMVFADPQGSFYRTVYLLRRSTNDTNPDCVETIQATRVPD